LTPKVFRNTPGARLEPPIPRRRTFVYPSARRSSARSCIGFVFSIMTPTMCNHPRRFPISAALGFQTV
jgi:hypothetical protein